ncbi:MAG TPA: pyruvate, phosphate dikinase, partial [Firmicutes bacterium]|nr:pyruvate, phosphate dikinase [Bacillota bacterium]
LKVYGRYSPTMYMLHKWQGSSFLPVTESAAISSVLTGAPWPGLKSASYRLGVWDRMFMHAEEVWSSYTRAECSEEKVKELFHVLVSVVLTEDPRLCRIIKRYLTLDDLIYIWKRMIGTGYVGGKSIGMLLAQAILKKSDSRWVELLEAHDSFFIGSEVFYTYLVLNDCWWLRQKQRHPKTFLDGAEEVRQRILKGQFPEYIVGRFCDMLNYFGQSPIIVRSSSLLEDSFGNSFAGKYESLFCPNQGPFEKRLEEFQNAIRTIYASCMSEEALTYRARRKLLDRDEQMALLVQRVSGAPYGDFFYPQIAGVGLSFNPYVWGKEIEPGAGMIRLVFGLGTRAVNRSDDDYTRVVALNAPQRRPEKAFEGVCQHTQQRVELLDLKAGQLVERSFEAVAQQSPGLPLKLFASLDEDILRLSRERGMEKVFPWTLTFEKLLSETRFVADVRSLLRRLQDAYQCPVEVEFTVNFFEEGQYKVNVVQCRPFQIKGSGALTDTLREVAEEDVVFRAVGAIIGQSLFSTVDRIIHVIPSAYAQLVERDRYSIARLIGTLVKQAQAKKLENVMLLGPGRWGTTTPSLGIPVSFGEISAVSILCEIVAMRDGLIPDVSLGTHFFSE